MPKVSTPVFNVANDDLSHLSAPAVALPGAADFSGTGAQAAIGSSDTTEAMMTNNPLRMAGIIAQVGLIGQQ